MANDNLPFEFELSSGYPMPQCDTNRDTRLEQPIKRSFNPVLHSPWIDFELGLKLEESSQSPVPLTRPFSMRLIEHDRA